MARRFTLLPLTDVDSGGLPRNLELEMADVNSVMTANPCCCQQDTPLLVRITVANLTNFDSHIEINGPKQSTSPLVVANGTARCGQPGRCVSFVSVVGL